MELSIIFVNWNSTDYLLACIQSILENTQHIPFEIIVVDNASPSADADRLNRQFAKIKLIKSPVNLGFAGANNAGFKFSSGEYLLFLNPDTRLLSPAIAELLDRVKALPDAGVVGCKLLNGDLSIQTSCIQSFPTILNQALDAEFLRRRWPQHRMWGMHPLFSGQLLPAKVDVISGACMMIRREVFEQVGLFSEDYFMYAEDLDLCYRAKQAGYSNYYVGAAKIIHYGGGSSTPLQATKTKWNSILQYLVKHRGMAYTLSFRAALSIVAIVRLALLSLNALSARARQDSGEGFTALQKWKAILTTLLTRSGAKGLTPPEPGTSRFDAASMVQAGEMPPKSRIPI